MLKIRFREGTTWSWNPPVGRQRPGLRIQAQLGPCPACSKGRDRPGARGGIFRRDGGGRGAELIETAEGAELIETYLMQNE
jgi:hypothetical protein